MAATKWTPQVIAAEVARKKAAGESRNYGKPAAPQLSVKPQINPVVTQKPVGGSPVVGTTMQQKPAVTTQQKPSFSYGGNVIGFTPPAGNHNNDAIQKQIADLGQQWHTAAPGQRGAIHEQAQSIGKGAGGTFDQRTGKWTFPTAQIGQPPTPQAAPEPQADYTGAEYQNEIDAQTQAYMAQLEGLKSASMFGVNQNNAFLDEQVGKMKTAKNQNDLTIQETENRFGGVYSGGMRLGQAANLTSTNEAIGGVTRDVAARNQQLLDQYGSAASGIAENIQKLQSSAPGIIRDKILEYQMKQAPYTGTFNGQRTLEGQEFDWDRSPDNPDNQAKILNNQISQLKLQNLPQELKLGLQDLENQVKAGEIDLKTAEYKLKELQDPNSITNQSNRLSLKAAQLGNEELRKRIDEIGKIPAMTYEEQRLKEIALKKAEIELTNLENGKPDKPQTAEDMRTYYDSMVERDSEGKITNKDALKAAIVESPLSDYEVYRTFLQYQIPWTGAVPSPNG